MARRPNEPSEESFLKDVANHRLTIVRDDDLHRHLRFARPGTGCMHFDLITWPGYLCFCGDMGCYVFSRLTDMFEFFRRPGTGPVKFDTRYWAEKLQSTATCDGHVEYSADRVRAWVAEKIQEFKEQIVDRHVDEPERASELIAELIKAIEQDVLSEVDDGSHAAYTALRDFKHAGRHWFQDSWEVNFQEYTFRFIWCCHALVWGIRQYDAAKAQASAGAIA